MTRRAIRGVLLAAVLGALLSGCAAAPHALGLHDTGVTQSLPLAEYPDVWAAVPLDDGTDEPVTIRSLALTGARNIRHGRPFVIEVRPNGYIDWYAPPGTTAMRAEIANRVPLAGFRVPAHTRHRFEAVVLLRPRDTGRTASITGATVTYTSGGHEWTETWVERSSLRGPG